MKYWTTVFPGEYGQHVQETWSDKQILSSAWYKHWVKQMIRSNLESLITDELAIDDWKVVHWAVETNQFGAPLPVK